MKKSGVVAASMAAASATAISASSKIHHSNEESDSVKNIDNSSSQRSNSNDKFKPRFDGLRFIETLVTAHR